MWKINKHVYMYIQNGVLHLPRLGRVACCDILTNSNTMNRPEFIINKSRLKVKGEIYWLVRGQNIRPD